MPYGWGGNRRSSVVLAMHHRLQWFIHLRAYGLRKGDEHPDCTLMGRGTLYFLTLKAPVVDCFATMPISALCRALVSPSECSTIKDGRLNRVSDVLAVFHQQSENSTAAPSASCLR